MNFMLYLPLSIVKRFQAAYKFTSSTIRSYVPGESPERSSQDKDSLRTEHMFSVTKL